MSDTTITAETIRSVACASILRRLVAAPGRADRLRRSGWRVERVDPR